MGVKRFGWVLGVVLLVLVAACGYRRPPLTVGTRMGFRLPQGDVARGEAAFREFKCYRCHVVKGMNFPSATALRRPVTLGGEVQAARTDGYLVTSIIYPSHMIAPEDSKAAVTTDGNSLMPSFTDRMSVRQLLDLVAFLQSRYKLVPALSESNPLR